MRNSVDNLKAGVETSVKSLSALRTGLNLKRQHVVDTLKQPAALLGDMTKALKSNTYKSYPDVLQLRDSVRSTCTTCLVLSEQVDARRIKPRELMEKLGEIVNSFKADVSLAISCIEYLPASSKKLSMADVTRTADGKISFDALVDIQERIQEEETNERAVRREQREDAATEKTSRVLQRLKDTYAHKVPRTFKNESIRFIQLPVMARFGTFAMSPDALTRMGFKIQTAGLHSTPSADLGLVFENQLLVLFRMSDAKGIADQAVKDHKKFDGTLVERKRLQQVRNAHRRELKKLTLSLDGVRALKTRREINAKIAEVNDDINTCTMQLNSLDPKVRESNSKERVYRQMKTSSDHAMLNYLNPIIDSINEKSSQSLGLLTTRPLRGLMKDSDVHAAWLMEKSAIQLLLRHTGGDMKLQNWFLPWTNG